MSQPVVLFDGVCNLCHTSVRFIIKRDPQARFHFASLQSAPGQSLLARYRAPGDLDTVVLIEDGQCYTRSTAALRICRRLNRLWPVLYVLMVFPRPLRDAVYQWIARNRYRWFGRLEACPLPDPGVRGRFLDG